MDSQYKAEQEAIAEELEEKLDSLSEEVEAAREEELKQAAESDSAPEKDSQ